VKLASIPGWRKAAAPTHELYGDPCQYQLVTIDDALDEDDFDGGRATSPDIQLVMTI
jgi:hypothetical protein